MRDVFLITIDAWRYDAVSAMPRLRAQLSDWDRREVICAGSSTPNVLPPLLNGMYAPNAYDDSRKIRGDSRPLPERLRERGYQTAGVIASNPNANVWEPYFDFFWNDGMEGKTAEQAADDVRTTRTAKSGLREALKRVWLTLTLSKRVPATQATNVLREWIQTASDTEPTFVWIHLMEPHVPYFPGIKRAREVGLLDSYRSVVAYHREEGIVSPSTLDTIERLYWQCIDVLDHRITELLGLVPSDAIAIVTGDHGEAFNHTPYGHGTLYDEVVRVPLFSRNLAVDDETVPQVDLPAYVLRELDVSVPNAWDNEPEADYEGYFFVGNEADGERCVGYRTGTHKIIQRLDLQTNEVLETEVYDLVSDPGEQTNVHEAGNWTALESRLEAHVADLDLTTASHPEGDLPDAVDRRLEELGYR